MIRSGGSSGFTEPERNPSSLTMLGVRQTCSASRTGMPGGRDRNRRGLTLKEVDKGKGRQAAARSLLLVNTRSAARWCC